MRSCIFVAGLGLAVSGGMFVPAPDTDRRTTYESVIASVLGVSATRASAIAAEYPLSAYPAPVLALSTLVSDANFACPALQVDRWTSKRVPTFAYQFDDGTAPPLFAGPGFPPIATHSSEIQYLFDQPNAPFAAPLNADQETLAASMRAAWANFAASGEPVRGGSAVAVVQHEFERAVARAAAAAARAELRRDPPLLVLGQPDDHAIAGLSTIARRGASMSTIRFTRPRP